MASPCPDITITPESSVQGSLFDEALVTTDTDFTSREDCDMFASYFYETPDVNTNISESPLLFSNLDVIVDSVWKPEEEQGFALMFQAVFNWLKSFGLNVDTSALQEYLPSGESVRLFTEISAGLLLLLALVYTALVFSNFRGYLDRSKMNLNLKTTVFCLLMDYLYVNS